MFFKYATAKIIRASDSFEEFVEDFPTLEKRLAGVKPISLHPDRYYYIINRAVSSLESYGPNDNLDGFPRDELRERHLTFVGSRVSVDHQDPLVIGMVLDTSFIDPEYNVIAGTGIKEFKGGDYVTNFLALDKVAAEKVRPGIIADISEGRITDTSMGSLVEYTECSIPNCRKFAHTEREYCEHISGMKGKRIKIAIEEGSEEEEYHVFEICHNFTFFEDSVIVPASMGGIAGGRGADPDAKMLQRIGSDVQKDFPIQKYFVNRLAGLCIKGQAPGFESKQQITEIGGEPEDVRKEREDLKKEEQSPELVVDLPKGKRDRRRSAAGEPDTADQALDSMVQMLMEGKQMDEALEVVKQNYGEVYEEQQSEQFVGASVKLPSGKRGVVKRRVAGEDLFVIELVGDEVLLSLGDLINGTRAKRR